MQKIFSLDNIILARSDGPYDIMTTKMVVSVVVSYPLSFIAFGYPEKEGSFVYPLLKLDSEKSFEDKHDIFTSHKWSHMCLTFDVETHKLRMALVDMRHIHTAEHFIKIACFFHRMENSLLTRNWVNS